MGLIKEQFIRLKSKPLIAEVNKSENLVSENQEPQKPK